tara:strand:- start:530 stop:862 length:333 start_codon:yes stop_codon:yes gene_type:complete
MSTKSIQCNYTYDNVFDLDDNILQYKFKPIYYDDNMTYVQPYNEQAQGIMPYKSSNTTKTDKTDPYLKYGQENSIKKLKSKINEQVSDLLNRDFNVKTEKKPYSKRGGNN